MPPLESSGCGQDDVLEWTGWHAYPAGDVLCPRMAEGHDLRSRKISASLSKCLFI